MLQLIEDLKTDNSDRSVLEQCGLHLEQGQEIIGINEAEAVVGHLMDIIAEQKALLKSALVVGLDNMTDNDKAIWEGTAEAVLESNENLSDHSDTGELNTAQIVTLASKASNKNSSLEEKATVFRFSDFK